MVRLRVNVAGDTALDRTLARIAEGAADPRPALNAIGDLIAKANLATFLTKGRTSVGGTGWAPLSPRYAKAKAKRYPGKPIMVRSGQLRRDLTKRPFGVERISSRTLTVGSNLPYLRAHQKGGPNLPARPILLNKKVKDEMAGTLQRILMTGRA